MSSKYTRDVGIGVGLLSAALMSTELVLTRIFSVVLWYHFAFFVISVALFGSAAAALFVHLRQPKLAPERTGDHLALASSVLALVIVGVDIALIHLTPDWFGGTIFTRLTWKLLGLFIMAAAPFFAGGFAIALAMMRHAKSAHDLYFWDLFGAGAACLLVIPLLGAFGGPRAMLGCALLATGAAVLFARGAQSKKRSFTIASVAAGLVIAVAALDPSLGLLRIRVAKGINMDPALIEFNEWNSFSMVTVGPGAGFRGWGVSPKYQGDIPEQKTLVIDLNAMTTITRFDGSLEGAQFTSHDLSAVVYRSRPSPEDVCIIGAGGGKDVLAALAAGAKAVTAVEINPLIVEKVVRGQYKEYSGGLYDRPDVHVVVDDGRSFVRGTDQRFDVLLLSMVDTSAATAAGAYALTENSLYTVDAFNDFFGALKPGGVFTVSSVTLPGLAVGARLASIARTALVARGSDPARSVIVVATPWMGLGDATMYDFLIKPDGFTDAEVEKLATQVDELGFRRVYFPGRGEPVDFESAMMHVALRQTDSAKFQEQLERWPIDISPTTDDRPFFFYQNRLRDMFRAMFSFEQTHLFGNGLAIVAKVVAVATLLVGAFLLVPLFFGRREVRAGRGSPAADLGYVACLGLGFMFVEIAFLQRFAFYLGQPVYTLAVVLFTLLIGGSFGSRWLASGDLPALGKRVPRAILALVGYAVVLGTVSGAVFEATRALPTTARALVAAVMLLPMGMLLGVPFPAGLRAIGERAGTRIPWLWSINGAMSVLASTLATVVALHAGITMSLWVGLAIYLVALALCRTVFAPEPASE